MDYLAFDIGGTAIKHALVDDRLGLRENGSFPTASAGGRAELVEALGAVYDRYAGAVAGVAISTAGELDPATGHMLNGGALRYTAGMNLLDAVASRCPVPVSVENDANCALLAERGDGVLAECRNAFMLIIGTGLGGALLLDGRLHRGAHFYAGSFSLLLRSIDAPLTLDAAGAPTEIAAWPCGVGGLIDAVARRTGRAASGLDGRAVFDLAEAGDAGALAGLDEYCGRLARLAFNAHLTLDVELIAVGGGISRRPLLVRTLARQLDAAFDALDPYLEVPRPALRRCRHGADANLVGAVVHHLRPEA